MKIAIACAGTTGAYCYRLLRKQGFPVDLYDRPHKTACGINPCAWGTSRGFSELLRLADLDPEKYVLQRFDSVLMDEVRVVGELMTIDKPALIRDLLEGAVARQAPFRIEDASMTDSTRWLWMAGLFLLGWLLYLLHPILSPFLIGILLAYLGDLLVDRLERHRLSRTGGVVVVFTLFSLLLLILLLVLVPMLGRQLVRLYQLAPEMLDWLQGTALPWSQSHLGLQNDLLQVDQLKQVFTDNIGKTTDVLKAVLAQAT